MLRSVGSSGGHVGVAFAPGDLIPAEVEVATRPKLSSTEGFSKENLRLRERIPQRAATPNGLIRFRTRGTVRPGTYYVAVSGFMQDATSCTPIRSHCLERWSNVLRVVVRAPA